MDMPKESRKEKTLNGLAHLFFIAMAIYDPFFPGFLFFLCVVLLIVLLVGCIPRVRRSGKLRARNIVILLGVTWLPLLMIFGDEKCWNRSFYLNEARQKVFVQQEMERYYEAHGVYPTDKSTLNSILNHYSALYTYECIVAPNHYMYMINEPYTRLEKKKGTLVILDSTGKRVSQE